MSKWISTVEEYLPPFNTRVLVRFKGNFYDGIGNYIDIAWLNNKNKWEKCNHCGIYLYPYPITHWMPLPEMPKDEI